MAIIQLHQETKLIRELASDTVKIIHATEEVLAIKKLVIAHEILALNLHIEANYAEFEGRPPWDRAAFQDLNKIRIELVTDHRNAFRPEQLIIGYYRKMGTLFGVLNLTFLGQHTFLRT